MERTMIVERVILTLMDLAKNDDLALREDSRLTDLGLMHLLPALEFKLDAWYGIDGLVTGQLAVFGGRLQIFDIVNRIYLALENSDERQN